MRSGLVVVTPPVLGHDLGIDPVTEPLECEALVPELAIEAFPGGVLPRLARIDIRRLDIGLAEPAQDGPGDEFRTVVIARWS